MDKKEIAEMDIQDAILQAKKSAGEADFASAQKILKKVITQEPKNIEAWLTLADVVQKPELAEKCLQQVLKIDPGNQVAQQKINNAADSGSELHQVEIDPVPQALEERFQSVAQPSMELADPWDVPTKTSSTPRPAPLGTQSPSTIFHEKPISITPSGKPKKSGRWLEFSLIGVLVVMGVCVLGLFFLLPDNASGEGKTPAAVADSSNDDPLAVIFANIDASNAESIPHYMATIHSKSPVYQSTQEMTKRAFDLFDLSYQVSGLKITKQTKNETVVAFTLTTRKIRGPGFRDNRISGDMILRKEDGRWKIYSQVVHDVKYLN
jgi:hypothetical protein